MDKILYDGKLRTTKDITDGLSSDWIDGLVRHITFHILLKQTEYHIP
jgi:hypothetical protein